MTVLSGIATRPPAGTGLAPLRAKWGWIVALGAVYLLAGADLIVAGAAWIGLGVALRQNDASSATRATV